MIKIEKKPLPIGSGQGRKFVYPWADLKIGDSFFVPHQHSITSLVDNYNSRLNEKLKIKVTRRIEGEGQRVWRIK